ncbi:MAG: tyrosine-type recombinase/integrase [Terriglobales bacterium]
MHKAVGLYSRIINPKTGRTQYASVLTQAGRPLTEGFARLGSRRIRHTGFYYLRTGDTMRAVGSSLRVALDMRKAEEHRLAHIGRDGREMPTDDVLGSIKRWARPRGADRQWVQQAVWMLTDFASYAQARNISKLSGVSRDVILTYLDGRRDRGDSASTLHLRLRRIVSLLKDNGIAPPIQAGRRGDWPKLRQKVVRPPSNDEVLGLLAHASTDDERLLIACYAQTGMRRDELTHATYADLDVEHRTIAVTEKEVGHPIGEWRAKTRNASRTIPIPYLADRLAVRQTLRRAMPSELIFPSRMGDQRHRTFSREAINQKFQRLSERAGISRTPKDQRDGFASRLWIDGGLDKAKVSALMGHAPADVTEAHYLTRTIGHVAECQEAALKAFAFMQGHF